MAGLLGPPPVASHHRALLNPTATRLIKGERNPQCCVMEPDVPFNSPNKTCHLGAYKNNEIWLRDDKTANSICRFLSQLNIFGMC